MKGLETLIERTSIPVVLTSDNNYTPFLYTTMFSALETANKNTFYNFYLIVTPDFSSKNKEQIKKLKNKYDCNINFIHMQAQFANFGFSVASWYRLLLADLLPEQIDKCIFLDDDICVRTDLSLLYNTDLEDNYVAGVLACGYYIIESKHHCKLLNIPSTEQYINTGVILYNLNKLRKDNITQKFIELSYKEWPSFDQDVMNIICYGKIKVLPPKYNLMTNHLFIDDIRLNDLYTKKEIEEAKKNPLLIHFLEKKPWVGFRKYGKYWWQVAIKTPYKFYFIFLFIKNVLNPIPKIKNIINNLIPKSIKDNFKKRIKLFVRADITNEIENNIISVKEQLDEQKKEIEQLKKIILEQNNEIENLKQKNNLFRK